MDRSPQDRLRFLDVLWAVGRVAVIVAVSFVLLCATLAVMALGAFVAVHVIFG